MRGCKRKRTPNRSTDMHPRNRYLNNPPDFYQLSKEDSNFAPYLVSAGKNGKFRIDWSNPHAVRALTRALLLVHFGIVWEIPLNRLCPPVPNRLNYIHWIEDLLMKHSSKEKNVKGIDIGTGASCIYPLLGAKMNGWHFLATDIDEESLQSADKNIAANHLQDLIQTCLVDCSVLLEGVLEHSKDVFQFCMCNPPFFDKMEESDRNPDNCCTGSVNEMTTPGGDLEFITRMIKDSLILKEQIVWYTSLVGRKTTLRKVLSLLREYNVPVIETTEFLQGKTIRWGIAWSFSKEKLTDTSTVKVLARKRENKRKDSFEFQIQIGKEHAIERMMDYAAVLKDKIVFTQISEEEYSLHATTDGSFHAKLFLFHSSPCVSIFKIKLELEKETSRSGFWKFNDQFKAAMERTGRKWRRRE